MDEVFQNIREGVVSLKNSGLPPELIAEQLKYYDEEIKELNRVCESLLAQLRKDGDESSCGAQCAN